MQKRVWGLRKSLGEEGGCDLRQRIGVQCLGGGMDAGEDSSLKERFRSRCRIWEGVLIWREGEEEKKRMQRIWVMTWGKELKTPRRGMGAGQSSVREGVGYQTQSWTVRCLYK